MARAILPTSKVHSARAFAHPWTRTPLGLDVSYLFERRHVAGAAPNAFLNARENAASES